MACDFKKSRRISLSLLLGCLTAPAAHAADDSVAERDEIIVTAQKRPEQARNVPISIAAYSGADLIRANVSSIKDLARITPNFSSAQGSAVTSFRLNIRGIGAAGNSAIEPSVAVFLDDVYVPRAASILSALLDIESAEVLRGPQGTLFGRNASAGALSLHSAKPTSNLSARIAGLVGNGGRRKIEAMLNIPISDEVAVRAAAVGQGFDGYWKNRFDGRRYGASDEYAGRISLRSLLGDLEWIVRADYEETNGDGVVNQDFDASSVSPAQLASLRVRLGGQLPDTNLNDRVMNQYITADLRDRHWGLSSEASLALGGGTLRLVNSYRRWRDDQLDGDVIFTPAPIVSRRGGFRSKTQSHELQFISPTNAWLNGHLDIVSGLYHYRERLFISEVLLQNAQFCNLNLATSPGPIRAACNANLLATGGQNATNLIFRQSTNSFAAYTQLNLHIVEPLTLVLGGRWTNDRKSASYVQTINTPFVANFRAPEVLALPRRDESRLTYRIGFNYRPLPAVLIFGSFSTGFKSGGYNSGGGSPSMSLFDASGNLISTRRVFSRETVDNYELGVKSRMMGGAVQANISLFRMTIDGYQDRGFDGVTFTLRNAGALRQQGVEFDATVRPVRNLALSASVAYLDSAFTDFVNGSPLPGLGGTQDLGGKPATFSPKWAGYVAADWSGAIGRSGLNWGINANLSLVSDQYIGAITDANPQTIEQGMALLGARLSIADPGGRWSVALFGNNLTDKHYATVASIQPMDGPFGLRNGVFPGSTGIRRLHGTPRTFGMMASAGF